MKEMITVTKIIPRKIFLLYIGGEGVATFQALFWTNNISPKALGIIQPGTGFGLNWTDFRDTNGSLAWVVNNNPAGQPDLIYYGGIGQSDYSDFDREGYTQSETMAPYRAEGNYVTIWEKQNRRR